MNQIQPQQVPVWDQRLQKTALVIGRLGLALLFFTQLFWKLPPTFGCGNNFAFPKPAEKNYWDANGSSGLCYWLGIESVFANQPREVLKIPGAPVGIAQTGISITPLAQLNGLFLDNVVKPGIGVWGWLIWLAEFAVFVSMLLGLFTRLGGLVALGVSTQLYIGLANVPRPYEWEWTYGMMILLSLLMFGLAAGRVFGIDGLLRRRLAGSHGFGANVVRWLS